MIAVPNQALYIKMDVMWNAAVSAAARDYNASAKDTTSNSQDGPASGLAKQRLNTWVRI
jgi:hypothetical protein